MIETLHLKKINLQLLLFSGQLLKTIGKNVRKVNKEKMNDQVSYSAQSDFTVT